MRLLVLANSYKEGGRCLAGIELGINTKPIFIGGKLNWIRPVCDTIHCQIPSQNVSHISILDIIEIEDVRDFKQGYQSENVLFNENNIKNVGKFNKINLYSICEQNRNNIFGNGGKAIAEEVIGNLHYSLMMISVNDFKAYEKVYDDSKYPKVRLEFVYNGNRYDFPVTDPVFLLDYKRSSTLLSNVDKLILVLSLAVENKGWHSKLISGIIY
jgi:hypothetical protein